MAEKRLNKDNIAPKNVLDNIGDSAVKNEKKVDSLKRSLVELKNVAKTIKGGLAGAKTGDTKSLQELNTLTKQANLTAKTKLSIDKELLIEKEKLNMARRAQAAGIKEDLALAKSQKGSLERIRLESKKLRNEKEKLNLTTKKGNTRLKIINRTLDRNNAILEKNATKLGKQKIAIGRYSKALSGLRRGLAQLGVSMGVFALFRNSFNVIKDFQQGQANLASVLGVNVDEMKALTEQAKELGATTRFTASQVSELQVELAKLGFTQQQIQDMTPATLALAEATGTELANAAAVAGGTLNAFGLAAKDTQRVVDVMAKSFSSSSLDMEKFKVAMGSVAPIAKTMGFSLEETTAMLGTLTDNNIDASTAGTSLRNMMLEASKQGLTWAEALDEVNNATNKADKAFELFGKRGVAAGVVLAENQEKVAGLTDKLKDADGAAQAMADTQRNTLGGALDLLKSAWEGLILSMDEAGGVGDTIRKGITFLADNLGTIVKILGKVIKAFIVYKGTLAALKLSEKIKDFRAFNKAVKAGGKNAAGASTGVKNFGRALKGIGLAVVIGLMIELAQGFFRVANGAAEAAFQTKLMDEAVAKAAGRQNSIAKTRDKIFENATRRLDIELRRRKAAGEDEEKLELERSQRIEKLADKRIKNLTSERDAVRKSVDETRRIIKKLLFEQGSVGVGIFGQTPDAILRLRAQLKGLLTEQKILETQLKSVNELRDEQEILIIENTSDIKKSAVATRKLNTELDEKNELLSRQLELFQELDQLELDKQVRQTESDIEKEIERALQVAEKTGVVDITLLKALIEQKSELLQKAALDRQEFEIATLKETNRIESEDELQKLIDNKEALLAQQGLAPEQKAAIEAQHQEQLKQFEMDELQRAADLELEILVIKGRTSEEIVDIKKTEAEELETIVEDVNAVQEEFDEKDRERRDKAVEEEKKRQEELRDLIEKFGNQVLTGLIKRSKEKQSLLDEEISKQQELADALREGAREGNAIATESLAQLESNIEAKERAKREEAEKEQNLERAKAAWNALNNFLDDGDSFPIASIKSISSVSVFESLVGKIKGFFTGTKGRLGDEDKAVKGGKDGHLIWADKDEGILNGGQMDQAEASGMNTTDDIIRSAVMFHQLKGINAENHVHNMTVDNSDVVNEIKDLKKIMKNKPEVSFHPHVVQGMADGLVRKVKKGSITNNFITHGK